MSNEYLNTCVLCKSQFTSSRSDAKYCSPRCRTAYSRRKQKEAEVEQGRSNELEEQVNDLIIKILKDEDQIALIRNAQRKQVAKIQSKIKRVGIEKLGLLLRLTYSPVDYYNTFLNDGYQYYLKNPKMFLPGTDERMLKIEQFVNTEIHPHVTELYAKDVKRVKEEITEIERNIEILRVFQALWEIKLTKETEDITYYRERIAGNQSEVERLEKEIQEQEQEKPDEPLAFMPPSDIVRQVRSRPLPKKETGEIGAEDLLNMNFDTFRLTSDLGEFLGELDRNMVAFALTGDSGAGKSYFSYELAKLFIDHDFTVMYFSLEEGIGNLTKEKVIYYGLDNRFKIIGKGGLKEVKEAARKYDVVFVDSYSKLTSDPAEFESLRQSFPETIFVVIFQKTTGKTMRGGSSIKYNSSATINVFKRDDERFAHMEKGRYGTMGWEYSIDYGKITHRH